MYVLLLWSVSVLSVAIFAFVSYIKFRYTYWKTRNIDSINPTFFFGNIGPVIFQRESLPNLFTKLYQESRARVFGIWFFTKPCLLIKDRDLIKAILISNFNQFQNRIILADEKIDKMTANSMFFVHNPQWKMLRSTFSPLLSSGKIKNMCNLISIHGNALSDYLKKFKSSQVDLKDICTKYTIDVISSIFLGYDTNSFEKESDFVALSKNAFQFSVLKGLRMMCYIFFHEVVRIFKFTFMGKEFYDNFYETFLKAIATRAASQHTRHDVFDVVVEWKRCGFYNGLKYDDCTAIAQIGIFFFAGFETTNSTMSFCLYELSRHPSIQDKVRADILSNLEEDGSITYESVKNMNYLEATLNETLRMYPVLPFLDRRCQSDFHVQGTKIIIEKNTPVIIPLTGLHYDPEYFPDPLRFNPERFLGENKANIPPYSYMPFGDGPRKCIGARFAMISAKMGVAHILKHREIVPNQNTPSKIEIDPKSFITRCKERLLVNLE